MSAPAAGPVPYQVVYSERVRQRLLALADVARERGDGEAFLAAVKEFHRRLCLYPQFGEPLIDLTQEAGQVWLGTVRPLAMRDGVFDESRVVMVTEVPYSFRSQVAKRASDTPVGGGTILGGGKRASKAGPRRCSRAGPPCRYRAARLAVGGLMAPGG